VFWKKKAPAPAAPAVDPAPAGMGSGQAFKAGFQLHQAGRLAEAAACYRQVLDVAPDHFGARHLLGVIALQEGRLDEARDHITQALRANPRDGAAYGNLGTVHLRAGRLAEARASYETALQLNPRDLNAASSLASVLSRQGDAAGAAARLREALAAGGGLELRNELGAALLQAGDASGAAREFQAVLREQPADPGAHNNLGLALERGGDRDGALLEYERALALQPGFAQAAGNRATLLVALGRLVEARQGFEQAVQAEPQSAQAHANLGALLRELGELAPARAALERALTAEPRLFEARFNLVQVALAAGEMREAQQLALSLLKDEPRSAPAHALRAQLLQVQGQLAEADAALSQALELDATLAEAHHLRGLVRMAQGDAAGARASHEEALRLDPSHAQARWAAVMARLPAMVDEPSQAPRSRAEFERGIAQLEQWFTGANEAQGRAAVGSTQPFYLAYQRGNHRDVLAPYGRLCERLARRPSLAAAVAAPAVAASSKTRPEPGRRAIRIGIVSAHLRDHSVWTAIVRGWASQLDAARFELSVFAVGGAADAQTALARTLIPRFDSQPAGADEWAARIARVAPHVLVYPEVGMDAMTLKLAAQRLAPQQIAAWGHPLTTGLPTIDAYVSAQAFEPPGAQDQYTEELVALPGLGVCYEPLAVVPQALDRRQFGLPPESPLLLCPGLPHKYAPEDDGLWADIAQQLPHARLVFFRGGAPQLAARLEQRLQQVFEARGMELARHAVWLPKLSRPQFFGLMREATLFLDSVGFSGFNTAMQAIECGLPVVALEGGTMRARFGSGILREAGLDECVAGDAHEYAAIAVALAQDAGQRAAIASHLRRHAGRLFATTEPVRALADFLESRVAA
jgi:protein O-GlcNAc transferase